MPFLLIGAVLGAGGVFATTNVAGKLVNYVIIGGIAYYIYKKA